jgi:hypothetical protein
MSDPLVILSQMAEGRGAVQVDRDGEGRATFLMSGTDAALLIGRMPEYAAGVYITFVPFAAVQSPKPRKRKRGEPE